MKSRRKKDKDITYNVYRQIESGDVQKIAGGVEKTEYIDKNADKALGTIRYQVSAVVDGKETKLSEKSRADRAAWSRKD